MKMPLVVSMLPIVLLAGCVSTCNVTYDWQNASKGIAYPVADAPEKLTPLMERELRGCFEFLWKEWISGPDSPTYGMTSGDYVGMGVYSPIAIESQGFYFAAIVIGVERGWIARAEGYKRILITLNTIKKLKNILIRAEYS